MNKIVRLLATAAVISAGAAPALAHPGDHSAFAWPALGAHLFVPDHLVFIVLIVVVGFSAFRAGRRAERRAQQRSRP